LVNGSKIKDSLGITGFSPKNLSLTCSITAEAKLTAFPVIDPAILFQTTLYGVSEYVT